MNEQVFWYVARASGLVAWVLLTASVIWGLTLSTRPLGRRPRPPWMLDLHRYLGGSALVYTGFHLLALWADNYVTFTVADLFVPGASSWRPSAVGWGIVAFYLLVAVEASSLVMRRLPKTLWRAVHVSSLGALVAIWVHAFAAGTDMGGAVARWFALASVVVVLFLTAYRGLIRLRLPALMPEVQGSIPERVLTS